MHCDQCGKENRSGSKFCRSCGNTLSETSYGSSVGKGNISNISWKSPIVLVLVGLVVFGGLAYGGIKAYAYYQVESKISSAKKLQATGEYKGSIDVLNGLENKTFTNTQRTRIESIKTDNQKFITFKTSFDNAITAENATPSATTSLSVNLQSALKDLQSIDTSYPDFKSVQTEIVKVQNALVVSLQNESDVNKKAAANASALAEKNRQAAVSAQAAKTRAEENAQKAQSAATAAKADAAQVAADAQTKSAAQIRLTIINRLSSIYTNFKNNGLANFDIAIGYYNTGNNYSFNNYSGQAESVFVTTGDSLVSLTNSYTNISSDISSAITNLQSAVLNCMKANINAVKGDSTMTNYYSGLCTSDARLTGSFLATQS